MVSFSQDHWKQRESLLTLTTLSNYAHKICAQEQEALKTQVQPLIENPNGWKIGLYAPFLYDIIKNLGYQNESFSSIRWNSPVHEIEKTAAIAISLSRSAI